MWKDLSTEWQIVLEEAWNAFISGSIRPSDGSISSIPSSSLARLSKTVAQDTEIVQYGASAGFVGSVGLTGGFVGLTVGFVAG